MTEPSSHTRSSDSVMAGAGYYSANSRPQHVAAEVAYPYLTRAAAEVPAPRPGSAVIGDFGCAGGANEMDPMALVRQPDATALARDVAAHPPSPLARDGQGGQLLRPTPQTLTNGSGRHAPAGARQSR